MAIVMAEITIFCCEKKAYFSSGVRSKLLLG